MRPTGMQTFLLQAYGLTDVGREREVNEDSMLIDDKHGLYLVCDGMGGHIDGALASQLAVKSVIETVLDNSEATYPQTDPLIRGIENANTAIFEYAQQNPGSRGMGTTAVGIRFDEDHLHVCHVGDSRVYRLRGPGLQLLTRDHSLANLYADRPELEGKMGPPGANVIVRAVGLDTQVQVEHRTIAVEEEDLFLLCCDGLNDLVDDRLIGDIMRSKTSLAEMAQRLVDTANNNGGTDNITVILVAVHEPDGDFLVDGHKTTLGF